VVVPAHDHGHGGRAGWPAPSRRSLSRYVTIAGAPPAAISACKRTASPNTTQDPGGRPGGRGPPGPVRCRDVCGLCI
jgi:hypothetical protein